MNIINLIHVYIHMYSVSLSERDGRRLYKKDGKRIALANIAEPDRSRLKKKRVRTRKDASKAIGAKKAPVTGAALAFECNYTVVQLREMAKATNGRVRFHSKMNKAQMCSALGYILDLDG